MVDAESTSTSLPIAICPSMRTVTPSRTAKHRCIATFHFNHSVDCVIYTFTLSSPNTNTEGFCKIAELIDTGVWRQTVAAAVLELPNLYNVLPEYQSPEEARRQRSAALVADCNYFCLGGAETDTLTSRVLTSLTFLRTTGLAAWGTCGKRTASRTRRSTSSQTMVGRRSFFAQ